MSWSHLLEEYETRSWNNKAAVERERLLAPSQVTGVPKSETKAGRGVKNKS